MCEMEYFEQRPVVSAKLILDISMCFDGVIRRVRKCQRQREIVLMCTETILNM